MSYRGSGATPRADDQSARQRAVGGRARDGVTDKPSGRSGAISDRAMSAIRSWPRVTRAPVPDTSAAGPARGGTMSDAGDEHAEEVDETPGVEEWLADESQAGAIGVGGEDGPPEE